ncbi:protein transport protein SFT2 [Nilaparvata lugens]|uniref:protein transport protein SFT2 n=1 Tax=Nilaparvata lugens TaxID=108931 RepID=UPI00193DA1A0|nr:protein transport protein SFT2 [Nilaparvata lugens]
MTKFQRITGFCICVVMSGVCFTFSAMYIPVLLFKARKFALLYTLGSLFFIGSFSFLWGPLEHLKHLLSRERILFTVSYLGSLFATLYFALGPKSTPLTLLFAVAQVISLLWFLMNYVPGGQTGLKLFTKLFSRTVTSGVSNTLPI